MKRPLTYMRKKAKPKGIELELAQCALLLVWFLSTGSCAKISKIQTEDKRHK